MCNLSNPPESHSKSLNPCVATSATVFCTEFLPPTSASLLLNGPQTWRRRLLQQQKEGKAAGPNPNSALLVASGWDYVDMPFFSFHTVKEQWALRLWRLHLATDRWPGKRCPVSAPSEDEGEKSSSSIRLDDARWKSWRCAHEQGQK